MKDELPAPEFDAGMYERPTAKWLCGRAATEGRPCRVGPDDRGNCRATFDCTPALERKEGEAKGRYRCMRPKEFGGPCEHGPQPDGTCGVPVLKCAPVRSVRGRRGALTWAVVIATVGVLLVLLAGPKRREFINPGPVAHQHAGIAFAQMHGGDTNLVSGCAVCHTATHAGMSQWIGSVAGADPGPFHFARLASTAPPDMNAIDHACLRCHPGRDFHEPNVTRAHSCSACHQEHRGSGALHHPLDRNCASCHADAAVMQASRALGRTLPASDFDFRPSLGRLLFKTPRPEDGYTKVFSNFATDHPEFQIIAEKLKEPNTLRFNHARHFAGDIPPVNGKKLDCATCHQPDASGRFHLRISFEQHCRACHSLQFDAANPRLTLPHGDPDAVRAFLHSLPRQYADFARREKGITGEREMDTFVRQQLGQLRAQNLSVDELEQKVFFSTRRWAPGGAIGNQPAGTNPQFYGCAYCHEVKPSPAGAPLVTPSEIPDRWMIKSSFDHAKHRLVACATCHDATASRDTADILLPGRNTCVTCHSPAGGVAHRCSTCHSYHTHRR